MISILQRFPLNVLGCSFCFYLSLVAGPARGPSAIKSFVKESGSVHESISSISLCMAACLKSQLLNGSDWYSVIIMLRFSTSRLGTLFRRMWLHFSSKGRWTHFMCLRNWTTLLGLLYCDASMPSNRISAFSISASRKSADSSDDTLIMSVVNTLRKFWEIQIIWFLFVWKTCDMFVGQREIRPGIFYWIQSLFQNLSDVAHQWTMVQPQVIQTNR